ncbi:MAG TPA: hypothetical protein VEU08_20415, partial [Vicinamibacterales bacterium]|nr:hypothetical protein [Vicinamibacterales bacterium]
MRSAIVRVGALMIGFRIAGLAERYLVQPDIPFSARLALFAPAAMAHAGTLLLIVTVFLLAARALPRSRRAVSIAACATFATLVVAGQADFIVSSITGAPLTPTVFRTFRGLHVVRSNEFLEPLRAHLPMTVSGAAVFVAGVWWMSALVRRENAGAEQSAGRPERGTPEVVLFAAALVLSGAAAVVPWPVPPPPIEVAFAREYLGLDRIRLRRPEAD